MTDYGYSPGATDCPNDLTVATHQERQTVLMTDCGYSPGATDSPND